MKQIALLLAILACIQPAQALVIHQVYYDPIQTERGGEFIQVHNNANDSIDISNYIIETTSSQTDATIPQNTILNPNTFYLIADEGFNESKDNTSWPNADLEDAITLKNTDGAVAIINTEGEIVDAVGWGNPPNLFETTPANEVDEGKALLRINNTNNNANDFTSSTPTFTTSIQQEGAISVAIEVLEPRVIINQSQILIDHDNQEGIQLYPFPGQTTDIPIEIIVHSENAVQAVAVFKEHSIELDAQTINDKTKLTGTIPLEYNTQPNQYNITVTLDNNRDVQALRLQFEVLPVLALKVSDDALHFGSVLPGRTAQVNMSALQNIGNTPLKLGFESTHLYDGVHAMNASQLSFRVPPGIERVFSTSLQVLDMLVLPKEQLPLTMQFNVPEQAVGGAYQGAITLRGMPE